MNERSEINEVIEQLNALVVVLFNFIKGRLTNILSVRDKLVTFCKEVL